MLAILGVITVLRFDQLVGQAGIYCALMIVVASNLIAMLTSPSLSDIATNAEGQGGGAYFLIYRRLGVEFGGAIGIVSQPARSSALPAKRTPPLAVLPADCAGLASRYPLQTLPFFRLGASATTLEVPYR